MIRFSFNNILTTATASSGISPELALVPVFSKVWKSANPFSNVHSITSTFTDTAVSCLGLFNLIAEDTDATLLIQLKLAGNTVKEISTTVTQVVYGYGEGPYGILPYGGYAAPGRDWMQKFRVFWFEDIICDELYIEIGNTSQVEIGYIHLGPSWSPPFGINQDYSSTLEPLQLDIVRTIGGSTTGQVSRYYRCVNVTLQLLTSEDLNVLLSSIDPNKPVVFSAFAEKDTTQAIYGTLLGRIPEGVKAVGAPHKRFNAANLKIEECK